MESDEECDACGTVIVARCYNVAHLTARGGYMRADRLSIDAADQANLMFDAWKGNKVKLTPGLAHRDLLSFEARISIK